MWTWHPSMLPTTLLKMADPASQANPLPVEDRSSAERREMTFFMMPRILLLTLWTALCTVERGMAKALTTTQYDVALANQNRNISVSTTGPQPWSHSSPRSVIKQLNDRLDRQKLGRRSLMPSKYTVRMGTVLFSWQ